MFIINKLSIYKVQLILTFENNIFTSMKMLDQINRYLKNKFKFIIGLTLKEKISLKMRRKKKPIKIEI